MTTTPSTEAARDHRADPVWNARQIVCKRCRQQVIGNGTGRDPWRHPSDPTERGVTA